jgi:hypothetical protein
MPNGNNQLSEKQLKFGYWYVSHKGQLRKFWFGVLIVLDVLLVGYALYGLVDYFLISWTRDQAVSRNLGQSFVSHDAVRRLAPIPLATKSVHTFRSGEGRYDLLAILQNQNVDWYATFRYEFVVAGAATSEQEGFILPTEEKYIAQFAQALGGVPRDAEFRLTSLAWHHVNRHVIRDYESWRGERLRVATSDVTHQSNVVGLDQGTSRTSFDIQNPSAFGYWRLGLFVTLLRGTTPVAVNYITLENFDSSEERHVDVHWFEPLPGSSTIDIRPEVNLFDPDVYLPPRAQ